MTNATIRALRLAETRLATLQKAEHFGYNLIATDDALRSIREAIATETAAPDKLADHRNDTVDSLTQAEAFISGFEDDPGQEGVADTLAGLRAAIPREQARPALLDVLKAMRDEYGKLHDFLSDAIESGRLREYDIPDDYQAIVTQLERCGGVEDRAKRAIDEAEGRKS
ncbi:hypothetical protein [Mesorhizobium sp.]|uniref:hypothetical protein n=1 Tax=Mesorhizobium sp. TaxID=1871066 RepID=UPI00121696E9|nr:hypothetical protein [Mesorhizobium sp.]TIX28859.1 MAG: hypothetical protein E5V35_00425 [Mesorhizobium sp.]